MPTFGSWELGVLEEAYEHVDYLSLHQYFSNAAEDTPDFLGVTEGAAAYIEASVALCDAVAAKKKQKRKLMLSFDEWNVWFHSHGDRAKHIAGPWKEAPALLEDIYTMEDALVVGCMLTTLVNHCDRVKIACIAQVVNVIAPIMTQPGGAAWAQSIFYPFRDISTLGRGTALRAVVDSPKYDSASRDGVPYVTGSFVLSEDGKSLSVFAVNRSLDKPVTLDVELRGLAGSSKKGAYSHTVLRNDNLKAVNTAKSPRTVAPSDLPGGEYANGRLTVTLPAASWNVLRVAL
jgi:alpha-N-arabinofuranosidase